MTRFYNKTKYGVVMLLVLAMILQVVGPLASNFVFAESGEAFRVDGIDIEGGKATVDWEYEYTPNGGKKYDIAVDFTLTEGKEGKLTAVEGEIGKYIISEDGIMTVEIYDDEVINKLLGESDDDGSEDEVPLTPLGASEAPVEPEVPVEPETPADEDDSEKIIENLLGLFSKNVVYADGIDGAIEPHTFTGSFEVQVVEEEEDESGPKQIKENIIDGIRLKYKDETEFKEGDLIDLDEDLRFELDWSLPNNHEYKDGDYFEFQLPKQLTVYNPLNGQLGDYGSYTVDMNGNVKFTFNENIEEESDVKGTFWFDTELEESEITITEETIEIVFNEEVVQKIIVNVKPTGGQAISKNGQPVNGNFNTEEVEWTVIVNTTRESLKNAIINDPILVGQELILDSIVLKEVEVDLTGNVVKEIGVATGFTNKSVEDKLNIELGDTNKAYKLTFKTKLLEKDFKEGTTAYKNTAYLKSDGIKDAHAGGSVSVSRPKSMEKTSSAFDKEDRSIEWTVKVNFNEQSLNKDDVITDEFTFTVDGEEVKDVFEIKQANIKIEQVDKFNDNGGVVEKSDAKSLFDITVVGNKVTYKLKEATNKAFILKYKTELKEGAYINKDGKITNKIDLNGKTATGSQGVIQQVGEKTNGDINYEAKTIDWTIKINADKQDLHNFVLKDSFAGSGQKLVEGSIKVSPVISLDKIKPNTNGEGFEINFGDITDTYTITYTTKFTYDFGSSESKPDFKNGVKITYETRDDSEYELVIGKNPTPNDETKNNGAKNGTVNNETKEITWTIDINYNQLVLSDAKVEDAIPDNQSLIYGSVKIYETTVNSGGVIVVDEEGNKTLVRSITLLKNVTDQFKVDASGNQVNIDFGEIDKSYRIEFKTKDKDGIYNDDEVYTNMAQFIPRKDEVHNLTANVTLPNQGKFLGKTGTHNKEDWTIDWKVDVNESLSTTSDFTVTDDLGDISAQILLKDTIKVKKVGSTDELIEGEGKDYKLTVDGNKFEIYFPGVITEAYVITYSSYIVAEKTVDVTNEAEIKSNDVIKGTTQKTKIVNVRISTGGGTGEGTTGGLAIEKFEVGSNRALVDIAFTLVKTVGNKEIIVREGTTDADGKLEWKGLKYGKYTLNEVIPEGYTGVEKQTVTISSEDPEGVKVLGIENKRKTGTAKIIKVDSITKEVIEGVTFKITNQTTKQKYTFTTNASGEILEEVPFGEYMVEEITTPIGYKTKENIPNITVAINATATIEVENVAIVTEVTVEKIWIDEKVSDRPESIKVNLLQNGIPFKSDIEIKVDDEGNWSYTFKYLPEYDTKGNLYKYTVTEHDVPGYNSEVDGFKITNTRSEEKSIKITKAWLDDNSKKRPDSIEVELFRSITDGEKEFVETYEIKAANNWKFEITKLPAFDLNGKAYTYEVKEKDIEGYESKVNGFDITNLRVGETEVKGRKEWIGGPSRKPTIELQLYRNGEKLGSPVELKDGETEYTWNNLDEFDGNGVEYVYSVDEVKVPSSYRKSISSDGLTVTNRYNPPVDPEEPYNPEKPEKPTDPKKPTEPEKPVDPEKPTEPEEPTDPTTPGGPGDEFENLGGENPSDKPEGEDDEFEDVDGGNPSDRLEGKDDKLKLPKTGSASPVILYGLGGLSLLVGAMLRRKKED